MHEVFLKVKPACNLAGVLAEEASVGVVNGRMEAFNKNLMISQPCNLPDFTVSATDLDFALRKVEAPSVKVTDANLLLTGGGSTRVKRLAQRAKLVKPEIETHAIADLDDLLGAIDDVYPFTEGDPARPWSEGARIDGKTLTATNSVILCQATFNAARGFEGVTLSRAALSYIRLRRADLTSWGVSKRGVLLEFSDGAWALASRMAMEMPDAAITLVDIIESWGGMQKVSDKYRGAFLRAGDWSDELMSVYADRIFCGRLSSEHDEPAKTIVGEQTPAVFASKALVAVMAVAQEIAFDRYPAPVPFTTKRGSQGLIAGRTS